MENISFDLVDWSPVSQREEGLVKELQLELGKEHALYGIPVRAVARANYNDDVLFELNSPGVKFRYVLVHLTWRGVEEPPGWPSTSFYRELNSWLSELQCPDEFVSSDIIPKEYAGQSSLFWILLVVLIGLLCVVALLDF